MADKTQNIYKTRKQLLLDNFFGGLAWGLGSGIGATAVVAAIGFILSQTQELPFLGQIFENFMNTLNNTLGN